MVRRCSWQTLQLGRVTGPFRITDADVLLKWNFEFCLIWDEKRIAADDIKGGIFGCKCSDYLGIDVRAFAIKENLTRTVCLLLSV